MDCLIGVADTAARNQIETLPCILGPRLHGESMIDSSKLGQLLTAVTSDDSGSRSQAALRLRGYFEDQVGDILITTLLAEANYNAFVCLCYAVVPKWIVPLERRIVEASNWPFDESRTTW